MSSCEVFHLCHWFRAVFWAIYSSLHKSQSDKVSVSDRLDNIFSLTTTLTLHFLCCYYWMERGNGSLTREMRFGHFAIKGDGFSFCFSSNCLLLLCPWNNASSVVFFFGLKKIHPGWKPRFSLQAVSLFSEARLVIMFGNWGGSSQLVGFVLVYLFLFRT